MTRQEFIRERRQMAQLNISELIERLTSLDLRTRFLAEMCLRDQTSTWLNFQPAGSQAEREQAVEAWRAWWHIHGATGKKRWRKN